MNGVKSQLLAFFLVSSILIINVSVHIFTIVDFGLCTSTKKLLQPQYLLLLGVENGKKLRVKFVFKSILLFLK